MIWLDVDEDIEQPEREKRGKDGWRERGRKRDGGEGNKKNNERLRDMATYGKRNNIWQV